LRLHSSEAERSGVEGVNPSQVSRLKWMVAGRESYWFCRNYTTLSCR